MSSRSIGFIGGGRVARILLGGLKRAGAIPATIVVSDADAEVLSTLATQFPEIRTTGADNSASTPTETSARALRVFGVLMKS